MNPELLDVLTCPTCAGTLVSEGDSVRCTACGETFPGRHGMLILSDIPDDIVPSNLPRRKPGTGTYWRCQNWAFLQGAAREIALDQVVLDIGAGPGDFKPLFEDKVYLAVDAYPYYDLDFVCDLTTHWPIRPASVDVVLLSNVLEHICEGEPFLRNIALSLKAGGLLLITVPFLIKIHQAPYDFVRYTHFALAHLLEKVGFEVVTLEAVYEPQNLARSMLKNLHNSIPDNGDVRNTLARRVVQALLRILAGLRRLVPEYQPVGIVRELGLDSNPYPTGYHIACRKAQ